MLSVKQLIFTITGVGAVTMFSTVIGVMTVCYLYYKFLRKSQNISSNELFENYLNNFNPEPLVEGDEVEETLPAIVSGKIGTTIKIDTVDFINLASNNYLNYIGNNDIETEAIATIQRYGVGSCGPRGFYGTVDVHLDLEKRIAKFMDMEEAVVYSYGFSTVASAIPAYCKRQDVIFCDEMISFAAQKGIDAAKCQIIYFKHNNPTDLENKIKEFSSHPRNASKKRFLFLEGIYLNTGNICDLPSFVSLRDKYRMRLFIDESLSLGVLGKFGRGVLEYYNVDKKEVDMVIGSLEGMIGSIGGFCVGSHFIIEHQRLSGLGYCFSASLPPVLTRAAINAFNLMDDNNPELSEKLQKKCIEIHSMLEKVPGVEVQGHKYSPVKYFTFPKKYTLESYERFVKECFNRKLAVNLYKVPQTGEVKIQVTVNIDLKEQDIKMASETLCAVSSIVLSE